MVAKPHVAVCVKINIWHWLSYLWLSAFIFVAFKRGIF